MRKLTCLFAALILASLGWAQPLKAQDGPGGILDWIHRLSGPSMLGPSASYYVTAGNGVRFRGTVSGKLAVGFKESTLSNDHGINMLGLQPTVEIPIRGPVEIGGGFAVNRMGGEGHDAVYHFSIPVFAQIRTKVGSGPWYLRVGLGAHYFPAFDVDDFVGPLGGDPGVAVETGSGEFSFGMFFGLDWQ
jgi:hypothetical protein